MPVGGRGHYSYDAVDPVTVSVIIDAPREAVFDYLQDVANRPEFTDHFLADWRLTREGTVGVGAGARFRMKMRMNRYAWADTALVDVERPHSIVEAGRSGKANRVRTLATWKLAPAASGTTRVSLTYETQPVMPSDHLRDALGARRWTERQLGRAMRRLQTIVENQGRGDEHDRAGNTAANPDSAGG